MSDATAERGRFAGLTAVELDTLLAIPVADVSETHDGDVPTTRDVINELERVRDDRVHNSTFYNAVGSLADEGLIRKVWIDGTPAKGYALTDAGRDRIATLADRVSRAQEAMGDE